MIVGILGAKGFLGSALCCSFRAAGADYVPITRANYFVAPRTYDALIDASGDSRRYWSQAHPTESYRRNVTLVKQHLRRFDVGLYVYVSTVDVYGHAVAPPHNEMSLAMPQTVYGQHKREAEKRVQKSGKDWLILRCSALIGDGMKKGVVHDFLQGELLRVSSRSRLQMITVEALSHILRHLVFVPGLRNQVVGVGGIGAVPVSVFRGVGNFSGAGQEQHYEMRVEKLQDLYPFLATSTAYLKSCLIRAMEKPQAGQIDDRQITRVTTRL